MCAARRAEEAEEEEDARGECRWSAEVVCTGIEQTYDTKAHVCIFVHKTHEKTSYFSTLHFKQAQLLAMEG